MTSCLFSCRWSPFWKEVSSKKGKNLPLLESWFYPFRIDLFQKSFLTVASPESVLVPHREKIKKKKIEKKTVCYLLHWIFLLELLVLPKFGDRRVHCLCRYLGMKDRYSHNRTTVITDADHYNRRRSGTRWEWKSQEKGQGQEIPLESWQ